LADITVRDMLDAGVHFGHRARHWNPKMAPFIYGERNQLHIIDLEQTVPLYRKTCDFVRSVAAQRGTVLFVGTKRAAQHAIRNEATRCGMPYVSHRWLGGTLTNLKTIKKSIARLEELEALEEDATRERFTKKEMLGLKREREKLLRSLGGIRDMNALPDAVFIIDLEHERIALNEARKLGIPVAAVVDTNCSPQDVDYMIRAKTAIPSRTKPRLLPRRRPRPHPLRPPPRRPPLKRPQSRHLPPKRLPTPMLPPRPPRKRPRTLPPPKRFLPRKQPRKRPLTLMLPQPKCPLALMRLPLKRRPPPKRLPRRMRAPSPIRRRKKPPRHHPRRTEARGHYRRRGQGPARSDGRRHDGLQARARRNQRRCRGSPQSFAHERRRSGGKEGRPRGCGRRDCRG